MGWNRRNPSPAIRKVWEAALTIKQEFRKSGQEQSAGESQDKDTLRTQGWEIDQAGKTNPSKSRNLQGEVRSYNSKVMEEINHHSTKASLEHLPCQSVHITSDMGKEGGTGQYSGESLKLFCPRIQNTFCPGNLGMFIHAGDSIKSFEADGIATDPHDIT